MKRLLSVALTVFMLVQILYIPVIAQDNAYAAEAAEVVFTLGDVSGAPGDRISVPLSVNSSVVVNSLAVRDVTYDANVLTLIGFENPGEVLNKSMFGDLGINNEVGTVAIGLATAETVSGRICDVVFVINDNAENYVSTTVGITGIAKMNSTEFTTGTDVSKIRIENVNVPVETKVPESETESVETEAPATEPVESEAPETNLADVSFVFHDVMCNPGDEIAVEITMDSLVDINSVALYDLSYDMDRLEFLGFGDYGDILNKNLFGTSAIDTKLNNITLGYFTSSKLSGKICSLMFRVKADAGYGMTKVSMKAVVKNNSEAHAVSVESAIVAAGHADFSFGKAICKEDGTVEIPLNVDTAVSVNSLAFYGIEYDKNLLTFVGFSDYSDIVTSNIFGEDSIDSEKGAVSLGYASSRALSGRICNFVFKVKDGVTYGTSEIGVSTVVKNFSDEIYSAVQPGSIVIGKAEFSVDSSFKAVPGDVISVNVYASEVTSPVDYIRFFDFSYDPALLTFVNYSFGGSMIESDIVELSYGESVVPYGAVCTLNFKVNEGAYGLATIGYSAEAKNGESEIPAIVVGESRVAIGKAEVAIGSTTTAPGKTAEMEFVIDSTMPVDTIVINNISYNSDVLAFSDIAWNITDMGDSYVYHTENGKLTAITIILKTPKVISGVVGEMYFTVKDHAADGIEFITFDQPQVYSSGVEYIGSTIAFGSVEIQGRILGDLDNDREVNIDDALLLFRHAMLPDIYPIDYPGTIDYEADGVINIQDALRFFRYTMLPDMYPIEW